MGERSQLIGGPIALQRMARTHQGVRPAKPYVLQCAVCETELALMPNTLSWPTLAELF